MRRVGFTLIELLVTIAIIAILATLTVGSFNTARASARDAERKTNLESIRLALESYANSHGGVYPSTGGNFQTWTATSVPSNLALNQLVQSGDLQLPRPAREGEIYAYRTNRSGESLLYDVDRTLLPGYSQALASSQFALYAKLERPKIEDSLWTVTSGARSSEQDVPVGAPIFP